MVIEIKVPSPGESISEATLARWLVENNSYVEKNQEIAEIESEKATLPLIAAEAGKIEQKVKAGETIAIGATACTINTSVEIPSKEKIQEPKPETKKTEPSTVTTSEVIPEQKNTEKYPEVKVTPVAKEIMAVNNLQVEDIINGLKRIDKETVLKVMNAPAQSVQKEETTTISSSNSRQIHSTKITPLRKKLSERLVSVKNETAMLTTFNEVDMSQVNTLRTKYQQEFLEKHGVKPGLMGFFLKAVCKALKIYPSINSMLNGDEILEPNYCDIAIAVQSPKGLIVPIIRNAETLSLAAIELKIKELAAKARENKITLDEMTGGTFTITNGGTFGSLLSTPIINPPQSGILGMHNIVDRPVAVNGQVVIRPMMYIALSYDHRLIDGKTSVSFLVKIKELIENPLKLLIDGESAEKNLMGI